MGEKKSYIVLSFDLNLQDNLEQTVTTPSTQLEKSTKNDQQTKGKKKKKKKNKAQSKAQSEEQNRVEMVTDNSLVEDPPIIGPSQFCFLSLQYSSFQWSRMQTYLLFGKHFLIFWGKHEFVATIGLSNLNNDELVLKTLLFPQT